MNILKTAVLGVAGWLAYRAWQSRRATRPSPTLGLHDAGDTAPPHGDPLLADVDQEMGSQRMAQSSRGFGDN
ncbi:hypothetical protein MNQ95_08435 [Pseudoxanthomonas daejeonensis]|uniref:hypothetical protein n=1 Tax=Pseudoxanthomonas daejeonensis TaxID=266062 RepID=UPI001F5429F2|nr:hypothetical protein [Pseudoxanthomonas daejeonensis]UNK56205.1 hypothetical protein MNQ95_08435 [Pseudoxanthomonas daejeonensis]